MLQYLAVDTYGGNYPKNVLQDRSHLLDGVAEAQRR